MIKTLILHNRLPFKYHLSQKIEKWTDEEYFKGNEIEILKINRYEKDCDLNSYVDIEYRLWKDEDYLEAEERLKIGL